LFAIAFCKCPDFSVFKCPQEKKVTIAEREFLSDQRFARQMVIGGVDTSTTKRLRARELRKRRYTEFAAKQASGYADVSHKDVEDSESDDEAQSSSDDDVIDKLGSSKTYERQQSSSKMNFPNVARACDRYGVSDRCAASIVSATLQDVGILNAANLSMVVDRSKVRKERCKLRRRLQGGQNSPLCGLYFDGRKDRTQIQVQKGRKFDAKTVLEEHICIVQEPN
jgi:hypothetical protein